MIASQDIPTYSIYLRFPRDVNALDAFGSCHQPFGSTFQTAAT
jgi:hypothetical protein